MHAHVFRSALASLPGIIEYQVTHTANGADIASVARDHIDEAGLVDVLASELRRIGLDEPAVTVRVADELEGHPNSGKLRRFIAMT